MSLKQNTIKSFFLSAVAATSLFASTHSVAGPEPFIGEIVWVGNNFCPKGFLNADGQLLSISQNQALFSLYGTIYGGDGRTSFALPDLRGRSPVHAGRGPGLSDIRQGQVGGAETVTLTTAQIPSHNHVAVLKGATDAGNADSPANAVQATAQRSGIYSTGSANTDMGASSISVGNTGGNQAHENRSPYLGLRACVATQGIFPSRP